MKRRFVIGGVVVTWAFVMACGSSSESGKDTRGLDEGRVDASNEGGPSPDASGPGDASSPDGSSPSDAAIPDTSPPDASRGVLTPSNLPANICDTPGTKDFAGGQLPVQCDAVIPQNGGPDICLFKFANVSGDISASDPNEVIAVVATNSMQLGSYWVPQALRAFGESNPKPALGGYCGGGGAGHGTAAAGSSGGVAYGSETASPLLPGASGAYALSVEGSGGESSYGGPGASAVQFVSCGTLSITGSITADGSDGYNGGTPGARGGGGGGSGGTILIEALRVSATASSVLRANGGNGGGGLGYSGGAGGTATSPPGPATCGEDQPGTYPPYTTGGGGGGAVGRIRINVAQGTQPELLGSMSPAPSIGTVKTH
ncbi:hypothetical protein LVJ94_48845 [Pendulispora rubella]|uniref:Lipoprotein n=1 Tax=Pendulispora rubella TaxID=2741070 RepID=A0ABZ2L1J2_9BACT